MVIFMRRVSLILLCLSCLSLSGAGQKRQLTPEEEALLAFWEKNVPEHAELLRALEDEGDVYGLIVKQSTAKKDLLEKYLKMDTTLYSERTASGLRRESKILLLVLKLKRSSDPGEQEALKAALRRAVAQSLTDQAGQVQLDFMRTQLSLDSSQVRQDYWETYREEMIEEFVRREVCRESGWFAKGLRVEKLDPGGYKSIAKGQEIVDLECQLTEIAEKYSREALDQERTKLLEEAKVVVRQIFDLHMATVQNATDSTAAALDQLQRKLNLLERQRDQLIELKMTQLLSAPLSLDITEF